MTPKYLFVSGCARSGTSAVAKLIGNHAEVVLGMERYGHLVTPGHFRLVPAHFEKDRFLNVKDGDTFYTDFESFHRWDPSIREKLGRTKYIGDKRPDLYLVYDKLFATFSGATVIFVYRNIFDVAASWNKRAAVTQDWPKSKDFKEAVTAWNESMALALAAIAAGRNIVAVRYEDIFYEMKPPDPLFERLGLKLDESSTKHYGLVRMVAERLNGQRESYRLTDEQEAYVRENTRLDYAERMDAIKLKLDSAV